MNRNTLIAVSFILVLSIGIAAYGSQVGFVVIKNVADPPTDAGDPEFSVQVFDESGSLIDWASDDEIVSGTLDFRASVTNVGSEISEIFYVCLEVSTPSDEFVGSWYFEATIDQEEYTLDWDTTLIPDGAYLLLIKYALAESVPEGEVPPVDPDLGGGGYDPKSGNVMFSMSLDSSTSGSADIGLVGEIIQVDYVLPVLGLVLIGSLIVFAILRFRR